MCRDLSMIAIPSDASISPEQTAVLLQDVAVRMMNHLSAGNGRLHEGGLDEKH